MNQSSRMLRAYFISLPPPPPPLILSVQVSFVSLISPSLIPVSPQPTSDSSSPSSLHLIIISPLSPPFSPTWTSFPRQISFVFQPRRVAAPSSFFSSLACPFVAALKSSNKYSNIDPAKCFACLLTRLYVNGAVPASLLKPPHFGFWNGDGEKLKTKRARGIKELSLFKKKKDERLKANSYSRHLNMIKYF